MIRRLLVIFVSCRVVPHSVRARKRSRCYVIRGLKLGKVGGGKKKKKKDRNETTLSINKYETMIFLYQYNIKIVK